MKLLPSALLALKEFWSRVTRLSISSSGRWSGILPHILASSEPKLSCSDTGNEILAASNRLLPPKSLALCSSSARSYHILVRGCLVALHDIILQSLWAGQSWLPTYENSAKQFCCTSHIWKLQNPLDDVHRWPWSL